MKKKNETWEIKYNSSIFNANYTNYFSFIDNSLPSTSIISPYNTYSYISQISSGLNILNSSYIYSSSSIFPSSATISSYISSSFLSSTFLLHQVFLLHHKLFHFLQIYIKAILLLLFLIP